MKESHSPESLEKRRRNGDLGPPQEAVKPWRRERFSDTTYAQFIESILDLFERHLIEKDGADSRRFQCEHIDFRPTNDPRCKRGPSRRS